MNEEEQEPEEEEAVAGLTRALPAATRDLVGAGGE